MSDSNPPDSDQPAGQETQLYRAPAHSSLPFAGTARIDWDDPKGPTSRLIAKNLVVGSSPNADIVLDDPLASRIHAELEITDLGIWVRDLRSKNGTWLQGIRVERALVPHLGRLRLGRSDLIVSHVRVRTQPADDDVWPESRFHGLLGGSTKMRQLFATLARIATSDAPALVHGETGTGKELVAQAIHDASPRAGGPFVVVDCAALPETLLDAELFGHARGAFTGATGVRRGAIESAHGGTVFVDEIGELPKSMQPKLLRVLEAKTVRRLGENEHRPVDVRFVFATHRDLLKMVSTGDFREDLYFRLGVLPVHVPPLRERVDDLEALVLHFLGDFPSPPPDVLQQLRTWNWNGNVRELRNFVDRMKTLGYDRALAMAEASPNSRQSMPSIEIATALDPQQAASELDAPLGDIPTTGSFRNFRERWMEMGERKYVHDLLTRQQRNVSAAAREAELDRTYLYKLMRKYGL